MKARVNICRNKRKQKLLKCNTSGVLACSARDSEVLSVRVVDYSTQYIIYNQMIPTPTKGKWYRKKNENNPDCSKSTGMNVLTMITTRKIGYVKALEGNGRSDWASGLRDGTYCLIFRYA